MNLAQHMIEHAALGIGVPAAPAAWPADAVAIGLVQVSPILGAGQWQRVDRDFNAITTTAATFNNHPTYAGIVDQVIDGQAMVRLPNFWFAAGTVPSGVYAGKPYWMICNRAAPGFAVHPAFMGATGEMNQVWVGKYQGTNDGGTKLGSAAGVTPLVSINFSTMRSRALARNVAGVTGFRLWSALDLAAIQMLASIEMGGSDSQALVGQGHVFGSSALAVDHAAVAQATWRGIVGLWGNVWQMVDGLKRSGGSWWVWAVNSPGAGAADFSVGYRNTGLSAPSASGWLAAVDPGGLAAGVFLPAGIGAAGFGDYFYSSTETDDRVAYHGGGWSYGANAGLFCLYVTYAASSSNTNIGGRLAKV
jgi:hypothetical protein